MKNVVSLTACNNYEYEKVKLGILKSIHNIGGLEKYINKGERVLLKINMLMNKSPEAAATTHPVVVKALAEILKEYGADVMIGDSPGGPFNERMLKRIYKGTGMQQIADDLGIRLNYNTRHMVVKNEKGNLLKSLKVTEMLNDVDKVISVSKLKTHGFMVFTGAVKNMFGIVPGTLKAEYHFRMPKVDDFANALIDICLYANPVLSIMDGIVGMEGDGPSAGIPKNVGLILASSSPYHLDVVATKIIGLNPKEVFTIKQCMDRKLCKGNMDDIELVGDDINKYFLKDYKKPDFRYMRLIEKTPRFAKDTMIKLFRPKPIFDHQQCIGCKICADNCPSEVINMMNNRPEVDLNNCIRCFCCQELCPKEAVEIKQSWLMQKIAKL